MSDRAGCVDPGIIRRGRRACQTGLVVSTLELSVGGPGWLRLWGVAGSPSVDCSPKVTLHRPRNKPSGPTETRWTGTLRGALLTAVEGEYNYRLPRRALPEVRDLLCALPRNYPSREARNGKVLGRTPTFDRDRGSGKFSRWESAFFCGERETGQVRRERRAPRRESRLRVPGSLL